MTDNKTEQGDSGSENGGLPIDSQHHSLVQSLVDNGVFPDALQCLRFAIGLGVHRGERRPAEDSRDLVFSGTLEGTHGAIAASEAGDIGVLVPHKAKGRRQLTAQFANSGLDVLANAAPATPEDLISLFAQESSA